MDELSTTVAVNAPDVRDSRAKNPPTDGQDPITRAIRRLRPAQLALLRAVAAGTVARHYDRYNVINDDYEDYPDDPGLCASSQIPYRPVGLRKRTAGVRTLLRADLIRFTAFVEGSSWRGGLLVRWGLTPEAEAALARIDADGAA